MRVNGIMNTVRLKLREENMSKMTAMMMKRKMMVKAIYLSTIYGVQMMKLIITEIAEILLKINYINQVRNLDPRPLDGEINLLVLVRTLVLDPVHRHHLHRPAIEVQQIEATILVEDQGLDPNQSLVPVQVQNILNLEVLEDDHHVHYLNHAVVTRVVVITVAGPDPVLGLGPLENVVEEVHPIQDHVVERPKVST